MKRGIKRKYKYKYPKEKEITKEEKIEDVRNAQM